MPTAVAPVVVSAYWNAQFSGIVLTFDADTDLGAQTGPFVCQAALAFPSDSCTDITASLASLLSAPPQTVAPNCYHVCTWTSASTLQVFMAGFSAMTATGTIRVGLDSPTVLIRRAGGASLAVATSVGYSASGALPLPIVSVTGPIVLGLCSPATSLRGSVAGGMAGRLSGAVVWYEDSTAVATSGAVQDVTSSLSYAMSTPASAATHVFTVQVTNWLGSSTTSDAFTVTWVDDATITVMLAGAAAFTAPVGAGVSLSATVNVGSACLTASGFAGSMVPYLYQWYIVNVADPAQQPVSFASGLATGLETPQVIVQAGALPPGTYAFTLVATVSGLPLFTGYGSATVTVPAAPLVAVVSAGEALQVLVTDVVSLDGSLSCDPNVPVPQCSSLAGLINGTNAVGHDWACTDGLGNALTLAGNNAAVITFPVGTFVMSGSPYSCVDYVSPTAVTTPASAATASAPVVITVRNPPPCPAVTATLNHVHAIIPPVSSITLNVRNQSLLGTAALQWNVSSSVGTPLPQLQAASIATTLPYLFVDATQMVAGVPYTFVLTATVSCPGSGSAVTTAQVTFAVSAGSTGGALSVSPASGESTSPFVLTVSGYVDDTDALPLQYLFLVLSTSGDYVPLSDYSYDTTLSAFLAANADGSPVKISVVAKNGFGAVTAKGLVYAFVDVTNPTTALSSSDVAGALASIANSGASAQSTAQAVAALAASVATSSDATEAAAAQSTLLDTLMSVNDASSDSATPQALSGQVSSLLALLDSASATNNTDTNFLNTAGGLVSSLLQQSLATISAQTQGADDPLAQSLIPSGLVSGSLSSLESYLESVLAALSTVERRRQLRTMRRALDANSETAYFTLMDSLVSLMAITLAPTIPGSPPQTFTESTYGATVFRTSHSDVGVTTPSFNVTLETGAYVTVALPTLLFTYGGNVDVLAVYLGVNMHEPSQPEVAGVVVDTFASLNFFIAGQTTPFAVTASVPVSLTFPLPYAKATSASQGIACGYWNETSKNWIADACTLGAVKNPVNVVDTTGTVTCLCTQTSANRSDVAYWNVPGTASPTRVPTTSKPTTASPSSKTPTSKAPTSASPSTTTKPTTSTPTKPPTTLKPTTHTPTHRPTTAKPSSRAPTTKKPTTHAPTTKQPSAQTPTTKKPTTHAPTTKKPTTHAPTTKKPTSRSPTKQTSGRVLVAV